MKAKAAPTARKRTPKQPLLTYEQWIAVVEKALEAHPAAQISSQDPLPGLEKCGVGSVKYITWLNEKKQSIGEIHHVEPPTLVQALQYEVNV